MILGLQTSHNVHNSMTCLLLLLVCVIPQQWLWVL